MPRGFRHYEMDERQNLRAIVTQMDDLYSAMGGRDNRPERKALRKCIRILVKEVERSTAETVSQLKSL